MTTWMTGARRRPGLRDSGAIGADVDRRRRPRRCRAGIMSSLSTSFLSTVGVDRDLAAGEPLPDEVGLRGGVRGEPAELAGVDGGDVERPAVDGRPTPTESGSAALDARRAPGSARRASSGSDSCGGDEHVGACAGRLERPRRLDGVRRLGRRAHPSSVGGAGVGPSEPRRVVGRRGLLVARRILVRRSSPSRASPGGTPPSTSQRHAIEAASARRARRPDDGRARRVPCHRPRPSPASAPERGRPLPDPL